MRALIVALGLIVILIAISGCSGSNDISMAPAQDVGMPRLSAGSSHYCLGFWRMIADPEAQTLDIIDLRAGTFHLNALPFLEPPPFANLSLEYLEFIGSDELIADVGLRHPFLGLNEFTGFDVCGVFISNGTGAFGETGLVYATGDDTHLLNPDGWTRWWNPDDFPQDGTMFNYKDGLLGTPDSVANFNTGLNAYKYYSDELDTEDDILICTPAKRGQFSAGSKNIRRFHIYLGTDGLIFNYAVDANWEFPQGEKPWLPPEDFSENANRPEAWAISFTEIENTLFNDGSESGGELSLSIDVYDHFNPDMNNVIVQSPGNFDAAGSATPIGGGDGYSTYQIDITDATPAEGGIPLYFIIESEKTGYAGKIPGEPVSAYFISSAEVSSEPQGCFVHVDDDNTTGPWDGTSAHPYQYLQDGVDNVPDDCTIRVHPGSYDENVPVTISGLTNVIIEGIDLPTIEAPLSISGSCPGLIVDGLQILGDTTYAAAFVIQADDVTIQNCAVTPVTTAVFESCVRGTSCSNLTVSGCIFDEFMGTVRHTSKVIDLTSCDNATVTLNTCIDLSTDIPGSGNTSESYVYFTSCTNSEISKNRFGVYNRQATGFFVHGYYIFVNGGSDNVVCNNLLYDIHIENTNWTNTYNYGIRLENCANVQFYNNTLDNMGPNKTSDDSGGTQGVRITGASDYQVYNNIITDLYSYRYVDGFYIATYPAPEVTYTDVWGLSANFSVRRYYPPEAEGEGCIDANPMFSDPDNGDYTLLTGSPCINTGRIGGIPTGDPTDMGCHGGSDPLPE